MSSELAKDKTEKYYRTMLLIGIILVAFNLRPAITSVGPLIGMIRDDIGLSNWSAGLLTSLPLIAFAMMSPIIPKVGNRYTNERVLVVGMLVLLIGISIRSISFMVLIFTGTFLIGVGIAVCNVLLPGVIKEKYPQKVGLMTSVYSTAMGIFAATASGLSVPIASGLGLGWNVALLVWVIPAAFGIAIWIFLARANQNNPQVEMTYVKSETKMWKNALAWQVALFMGLQSTLFYITISWLPEILHNYGATLGQAGWLLSLTQFIGLPASFFVPVIASRYRSQGWMVLLMTGFAITGFSGLLFGESTFVMYISIFLIGIALSGNFALALMFLGLRARNAQQAAELSGMAQSLGYILAAIGPVFVGLLHDLTNDWVMPLVLLIVIACFILIFGYNAGRNRYV
ncbi:CynX/NimT family MFS transporter [Virgibacillus soli]